MSEAISESVLLITKRVPKPGAHDDHSIVGHELDGGAERQYKIGKRISPQDWDSLAPGKVVRLAIGKDNFVEKVHLSLPDEEASLLKLRNFEITDIEHTEGNIGGPYDDGGRHIMLRGTAEDGTEYVIPVMTENFWIPAWDTSALEKTLMKVQIAQYEGDTPKTTLSHEISMRRIYGAPEEMEKHTRLLNEIFYPGKNDTATLFDMATSLTTRSLTVEQEGPGTQAFMVVPALVARKEAKLPPLSFAPKAVRALAVFTPYVEIDGKPVFIKTQSEPSRPGGDPAQAAPKELTPA